MIYKILPLLFFFSLSFSTTDVTTTEPTKVVASAEESAVSATERIYHNLNAQKFAMPKLESFTKALEGFNNLKKQGVVTKNILTLVDFSLSSNTKRLWVIDMTTNTILYHSLVAHGRNTGEEFANSFSNQSESFRSSLGFYVTGEVYAGKHGKSMRLDGLEKGKNDNARNRAVVMHGADYVSETFIKNHNRLGRSLGCPAIPVELTDKIINTIKDKSCLFIYHPSASSKVSAKLTS
jgi:hypothetical protein